MNYNTHVHFPEIVHPLLMFGVVLELLVDRNMGTEVRDQWVQPQESVVITGINVHAFNFLKTLNTGFGGWFRIHKDTLTNLAADIKNKDGIPWSKTTIGFAR